MLILFIVIYFSFININVLYSVERIGNYEKNLLFKDFNITSLMKASEEDDAKAVSILVQSGYNQNDKNVAGVSSLHICAKNNSINALKELLKYSPNINAKDDEGFTPLMRACMNDNNEIAKILIKNNASMWLVNDFNESALLLASKLDNTECCTYILGFSIIKKIKETVNIEQQIQKSLNVAIKKENQNLVDIIDSYKNNKENFFNFELVEKYFKNDIDVKERTVFVLDAKRINQKELKEISDLIDIIDN